MIYSAEQIEEMPAGREMDALIAEHICRLGAPRIENGEPILYSQHGRAYAPHYSTDMKASAFLFKAMWERRWLLNVCSAHLSEGEPIVFYSEARFDPCGDYKESPTGRGDTPSLAMCRAALLTLFA